MIRILALAGGYAVIQDPAKLEQYRQVASAVLSTASAVATALTGIQFPLPPA